MSSGGSDLRCKDEARGAFQRRPLDCSTDYIRLFKIIPRPYPEPIEVSIMHFKLSDAPSFSALSYMWGPEKPTQNIIANGGRLLIRQNLYDFFDLHTRGRQQKWQYLWADQLCIDQNSVEERNHQVQLMGKIYGQAQAVIVWLGTVPSAPPDQSSSGIVEYLHTTWYHAPYWTRLWIIQELYFARSIRVFCGIAELSEVRMRSARSGRKSHEEQLLMIGLTHGTIEFYCKWSKVMRWATLCECSDLRDKVYGLQNLLHPSLRVEVDYRKSVKELFLDAATVYVSSLGPVDAEFCLRGLQHLAGAMRLFGDEHLNDEGWRDEVSEDFSMLRSRV